MNNRSVLKTFVIVAVFITSMSFSSQAQKRDYVPDSTTAIKIAEAVWLPIFGKGIYADTPFYAGLQNDSIWHVCTKLPPPSRISVDSKGDTVYTIYHGGGIHALINKSDGRVINVYSIK